MLDEQYTMPDGKTLAVTHLNIPIAYEADLEGFYLESPACENYIVTLHRINRSTCQFSRHGHPVLILGYLVLHHYSTNAVVLLRCEAVTTDIETQMNVVTLLMRSNGITVEFYIRENPANPRRYVRINPDGHREGGGNEKTC